MGLLPEGEVLRVRRRHALISLAVGLVIVGAGIGITRLMMARGDTGFFLYAWGGLWFLGGGAALVSGIRGLLRPPVFALLTEEGVTFVAQRIRLIRWHDLVAVRLGLRIVTRRNKTEIALSTPLILTVRDVTVLQGEWMGGTFTHPGHKLGDGTAEILLKTGGCPLTNEALIRKLAERSGATPDLRPADPRTATLGGVKLNQPARQGVSGYFGAFVFLAFGLLFAGIGVNKIIEARASAHWLAVPAVVLSAKIETSHHSSSASGSGGTRYTPRISYRYTVNGQDYTGDRAAFIYESSGREARQFLARFPAGSRTIAYYNPQDPARAVLVREGQGKLWLFVAFGSLFAAIGGWLLYRLLETRRKARAWIAHAPLYYKSRRARAHPPPLHRTSRQSTIRGGNTGLPEDAVITV